MILELRDLACGYQEDKPVLQDINMSLKSGDVCAILGPNGVGKTTMFKTILNLLKPLRGQICINGEDISSWTPKRRAKYFSYVAQAHVPQFPYLVREIAMMGRMGQTSVLGKPTRKDYEIVEMALQQVGIQHLRDKVYTEISGGERQLLMIARALAQNPQILIMDEPTANLDYGNMITVMEAINRLSDKGLCIIFTTHMPDQAFMCNAKTAMMFPHDPMVFGESAEVITNKNLFKAYQRNIRVLQIVDKSGQTLRVCMPAFTYQSVKNK